ncbi:MAG: hypothetical protein HQL45_14145 [Alphaproteobacteria bacterium]|nr:hypothetical protein [Alphaproteobacteria bacterium]
MGKRVNIAPWGKTAPDWIQVLAAAVREGSLKRAGDRAGLSSTTVCRVLAKTYAGNYDNVEEAVRARLMPTRVQCPVEGDIPASACLTARSANRLNTSHFVLKCRRARARGCEFGGSDA